MLDLGVCVDGTGAHKLFGFPACDGFLPQIVDDGIEVLAELIAARVQPIGRVLPRLEAKREQTHLFQARNRHVGQAKLEAFADGRLAQPFNLRLQGCHQLELGAHQRDEADATVPDQVRHHLDQVALQHGL